MYPRVHSIALALAAAAIAPYILLKVLWLSGSTIGLRTDVALSEMHSTRMVVGNLLTIGLEAVAVCLIVGLTHDWGRRVPGWIVLGLAAGATGLLAPILLGLPAGAVLQLALHGDVHTSGMDDMAGWVFAVVYGGFGLLAVVIAVLSWRYVVARWGGVLSRAPRRPAPWAVTIGAAGMLPFALAMLWWGVHGPGHEGPPQMHAVTQRFTLAITGVIVIAGFVAPLFRSVASRHPRTSWLAVWTGCTTAALQGPTEILLADHGHPSPVVVLLGVGAVPAAGSYAWAVLRGIPATPESALHLPDVEREVVLPSGIGEVRLHARSADPS